MRGNGQAPLPACVIDDELTVAVDVDRRGPDPTAKRATLVDLHPEATGGHLGRSAVAPVHVGVSVAASPRVMLLAESLLMLDGFTVAALGNADTLAHVDSYIVGHASGR